MSSVQDETHSTGQTDARKSIAYSLDALIPGFYLWIGSIQLRIGGSQPEDNYSGVIHSHMGCAIVLPGYRIYSTYRDSYDPR